MKRKISKSKKAKAVRRAKSKTARRSKPKKVVRRSKPRAKAKAVRRRKCTPSSVTYTKVRNFVTYQPTQGDCMRLAKQFAGSQRLQHQRNFCKLGSCSPRAKCMAMVYYCYKLTKRRPRGCTLLLIARGFCKCIAKPIPPANRLVIYNCSKAK